MFSQKIANQIKAQKPALEKGFDTFKINKNTHYFFFADDKKRILLISKAYQTARTCRQALNRIKKNKPGINFQQKGDQFFFQLQNGNKQAFATSTLFKSQSEATTTAKVIQASLEEKTAAKSNIQQPTKHSFRIDFYRGEKGGSYRGIIEHLITREKESFNGLEISAIEQFLQKFIHQQPLEKEIPVVKEEKNLFIKLLEDGKPTTRINYPVGTTLQVGFPLEQTSCEAQIFLKPLASGAEELVYTQQFTPKEADANISINTNHCLPGFYRLTASVKRDAIITKATAALKQISMQGSRIVQLY